MHKKIRLNAAATAGLLIILFFLIIAVFAPVIAPYDPKEMIASYLPPSKEHILGTNDVGQDIFSEMVYVLVLPFFTYRYGLCGLPVL